MINNDKNKRPAEPKTGISNTCILIEKKTFSSAEVVKTLMTVSKTEGEVIRMNV